MKYLAGVLLLGYIIFLAGWWKYNKAKALVIITGVIVLGSATYAFTRGEFPDGYEVFLPIVVCIGCYVWLAASGIGTKNQIK